MNHKFFRKYSKHLLTWNQTLEIFGLYYESAMNALYNEPPLELSATKVPIASKDDTQSLLLTHSYFFPLLGVGNQKFATLGKSLIYALGIQNEATEKDNLDYHINAHVYTSILPYAQSHGWHNDISDVYYWQQQGQVKFKVYDEKEYTYIMKPGDCIFIPPGMYHDVIPLTARVGISFKFTPPDYECESSEEYFKRNNIELIYGKPDELRSSTQ